MSQADGSDHEADLALRRVRLRWGRPPTEEDTTMGLEAWTIAIIAIAIVAVIAWKEFDVRDDLDRLRRRLRQR